MLRLPKFIYKTLSVRLSLMVVGAMAILLMASLVVMFHYSRKVVKEEALQKASQTLNGTVYQIDNILLSVEQSTGNIFFALLPQLNNPEMMHTYSRKLVESNPYIAGCAIAFKENYYKDRRYFMSYFYRTEDGSMSYSKSPVIQADTYGDRPYTEQVWFTEPMSTGMAKWLNSNQEKGSKSEPIISFCLPIIGMDRQPIGVIGVDVSLNQLSRIVSKAKPSANSYCTLLDSTGAFIVHPISSRLFRQAATAISEREADPSAKQAVQAMISGETGYKPFRMGGNDFFVFYKPFKREPVLGQVSGDLGWSAGIVYPEDDIFGDYNSLSYYVLAIAFVGVLLLFFLSKAIIHHQLKPLSMLSQKARLIADGHYDEPIPDSHHKDEIGRLQDNFQQMQQSLSAHISEMEQLSDTLRERGEKLRVAYNHAQKADRMKTAFLHNMTNQMLEPAELIKNDVNALCNLDHSPNTQQASAMVDDILHNGKTITELLKNLLNVSDEEKTAGEWLMTEETTGKEGAA